VKECEERLLQLQPERQRQAVLLEKTKKDLDDAQRGAITMFNEQKRYEAVGLRRKNSDLRDERANLQRLFDGAEADNQTALDERDCTISDLRSLLERRNQELDGLEQSVANAQADSNCIPTK